MKLSDFFSNAKTRKIVINSDIDGFLSGMILQEYYDCEIVGFSNSKESIWLSTDITSLRTPIYIDIFVRYPEVYCIDQHIIAFDNKHIDKILAYGTKLNPNIDVSRRTFSGDLGADADYYHKYPFGTVHYLIALMKQDGIDVKINDLSTVYTVTGVDSKAYSVTPGQLVLRADDAMFSSLGPYEENAEIWWNNLKGFGSQTIDRLYEYLKKCDRSRNSQYKKSIGELFVNGLGCDGKDGAFDIITDTNPGKLQNRVLQYAQIISSIVGIKMKLPLELREYRGKTEKGKFNKDNYLKAITYAVICGPTKPDECFSYTVNIDSF